MSQKALIAGYTEDETPQVVYEMHGTGECLRMNDLVRADEVIATLGDWCDALGVSRRTVARRLRKGVQVWRALTDEHGTYARADVLRFEEDAKAQEFVRQHPNGASLREVAEALGINHETVREVERSAMDNMKDEMNRLRLRQACISAGALLAGVVLLADANAVGYPAAIVLSLVVILVAWVWSQEPEGGE